MQRAAGQQVRATRTNVACAAAAHRRRAGTPSCLLPCNALTCPPRPSSLAPFLAVPDARTHARSRLCLRRSGWPNTAVGAPPAQGGGAPRARRHLGRVRGQRGQEAQGGARVGCLPGQVAQGGDLLRRARRDRRAAHRGAARGAQRCGWRQGWRQGGRGAQQRRTGGCAATAAAAPDVATVGEQAALGVARGGGGSGARGAQPATFACER